VIVSKSLSFEAGRFAEDNKTTRALELFATPSHPRKNAASRVTPRSYAKQSGTLLIVGWVTRDIWSEKGEDGKASIVEEKSPVMTCAETKRATGAASSFFCFAMRIVKGGSVNQTQNPVRTIVWFRCNHAIRAALHHIGGD
jgi:hypothetical protein